VADILNDILDRHGRDGTRLVQILREVQDELGWLSPGTLSAIAQGIGWPRARVESTAGFYSFLHTRPRGEYRILFSNNITDRMLGNQDLMLSLCKQALAGARPPVGRRSGERRHHFMHRHVRPGSCRAGELPHPYPHDTGTCGPDGETGSRARAAERLACGMVLGGRQHPPHRHAAGS
jgi:hypothetical protein